MINVKNLYHRYASKEDFEVENVSFQIEKGEIFGFLGPSGAGKSTVQNILIGLLELQRGEVLYDGRPLPTLGKDFFNRIGVSFELPNLYEKLTGYENLKYYAGLFSRETVDPKVLLDMVGLADAANKKAGEYSKGMKQRLVFARSLVNNPEFLFLDEPTSGLDPATAQKIKRIILEQQARGITIFMTTHNMYTAEELCDRVAFINEGKIVALDSPKNLKLQYGTSSVKVEYRQEQEVYKEILFMERQQDKEKLQEIISKYEIVTMHSGEATLEEIFVKLTGRELS